MLATSRVSFVRLALFAVILLAGGAWHRPADADGAPPVQEIVTKMLDVDPWGFQGADVSAHAVIRDTRGGTRQLAFAARSRRWAPGLSKSLLRFSAPGDLVGTGFLLVQKRDGDDDRWLYLPDLAKSRRIAGASRKGSFVGTDFSYADLDRRDMRDAEATLLGKEKLGSYDTWHVDLVPRAKDGPYAKISVWIRVDNFVALKTVMTSPSGTVLRTLTTQEVKRIGDRWFVSRSLMTNPVDQRSTELVLDRVTSMDVPDEEFTVRNLEKT